MFYFKNCEIGIYQNKKSIQKWDFAQDLGADHQQECGQPEENWDWTFDWRAKGPEGKTDQYWIHFKSNWEQSQQQQKIDDISNNIFLRNIGTFNNVHQSLMVICNVMSDSFDVQQLLSWMLARKESRNWMWIDNLVLPKTAKSVVTINQLIYWLIQNKCPFNKTKDPEGGTHIYFQEI